MYFADFQDFRLVPWFGGTAEAYRYFNVQKQYNVTPMLSHINYHLGRTRVYLSRWSTFTLVNIYCPINRFSYGFLDAPYWFHDSGKCLLLTFRTNTQTYRMTGRQPRHVRPVTEFGKVWSNDQSGDVNAFTTIAVPIEYREVLGMNFLRPQMEWLYTVLGSYYRNFALFRWYDKYPKHEVPRAIRGMNIIDLMHRHAYPYWKYNKEIWRRCPNMISIDQIDKEFAAYYKEHLTPYTGLMHSFAVKQLEDTIYSLMDNSDDSRTTLSRIEYGTTRGTATESIQGQADLLNRRDSGR